MYVKLSTIIVKTFFKQSPIIFAIISIYVITLLSFITWGIPKPDRLFTYQMDEWHQMMAVGSLAIHGSNNISSAAHGPILPFLLNGIFFVPFYISGIINPLSLAPPTTELDQQKIMFIVGRICTLTFGVLTLLLLGFLIKRHFKISPAIGVFLITFTPIWMTLSNFFKYDIIVSFFLVAFIFASLQTLSKKTKTWFLITSLIGGLSLATKFSTLPIIPLFFVLSAFLIFQKKIAIKTCLQGIGSMVITFCLVGIPDFFLGTGDYSEFLSSNLQTNPMLTSRFNLGMNVWSYLMVVQFPLLFGHGFTILFIFSLVKELTAVLYFFFKKGILQTISNQVRILFILAGFFSFLISLTVLQLFATSNRALVLLPWMVLIIISSLESFFKNADSKSKQLIVSSLAVIFLFQLIEVGAWLYFKMQPDTRQLASQWLIETLPAKTEIGIEPSPIYQRVPDVINYEFYVNKYDPTVKSRYVYVEVTGESEYLSKYIITTQSETWERFSGSEQSKLLEKMNQRNYRVIKDFNPEYGILDSFAQPFDLFTTNLVPTTSIRVWER